MNVCIASLCTADFLQVRHRHRTPHWKSADIFNFPRYGWHWASHFPRSSPTLYFFCQTDGWKWYPVGLFCISRLLVSLSVFSCFLGLAFHLLGSLSNWVGLSGPQCLSDNWEDLFTSSPRSVTARVPWCNSADNYLLSIFMGQALISRPWGCVCEQQRQSLTLMNLVFQESKAENEQGPNKEMT